jgi:hypothetical protein
MEVNGCPIDVTFLNQLDKELTSEMNDHVNVIKDLGMSDLIENVINDPDTVAKLSPRLLLLVSVALTLSKVTNVPALTRPLAIAVQIAAHGISHRLMSLWQCETSLRDGILCRSTS